MGKKLSRNKLRKKRHLRSLRKLRGDSECPRISIHKSCINIFLQLVDDADGKTICSASTLMKEFKEKKLSHSTNIEAAKELGSIFVQKLNEHNVKTVVFDRSGYKYHGKVKAVAEVLRGADIKL